MLAREPASFWRKNIIAVVTLLRVLDGNGNKFRRWLKLLHYNGATFLVKKNCNEVFRGVYNFGIREKTLSQISYGRSRPRI